MWIQTLVLNLFILYQTHVPTNYEGVSIYYLLCNEFKTAFLPFIIEILFILQIAPNQTTHLI